MSKPKKKLRFETRLDLQTQRWYWKIWNEAPGGEADEETSKETYNFEEDAYQAMRQRLNIIFNQESL